MEQKFERVDNNTNQTPGTFEKVVSYTTTVSGYIDVAIEWTDRKKHEWLIIWLKEDLKIADTCKMVRENLLTLINNPDYFSPDVSAYFIKDGKPDYSISPKDPTQIAVLKKLINALTHAENGLRNLENVDLDKDQFQSTIIAGVVKAGLKTVDEIYTTLQLFNESGPEIQTIIAPHVNALLSRITLINGKLQEYLPSQPEAQSGLMLAKAVNLLPANPQTGQESLANLSSLIYSLPKYFGYLQTLIPTSTSDLVTKSVGNAEEYQALMIKHANEAQENFKALASKNSVFTLLPSCLAIGKALIVHSTDLMNTGAPLTKKAYLEAVGKLHEIKHVLIPQLIAELEQAEENIGLKPGILTGPALEQMEAYFVQLATQVENIAAAAGVIDIASSHLDAWYGKLARLLAGDKASLVVGEKIKPVRHLTTMQDEIFLAQRKQHQRRRLTETELLFTAEPEQLIAAKQFFEKIGSYRTVLNYNWNLSKLSQTEKTALLTDYKKFQSFFAAHYPQLDQLIVEALDVRVNQSVLTDLAKCLGISNHFTAINACKTTVLDTIDQALDQTRDAKFKAALIKSSIQHSEANSYNAQKEKIPLKIVVAPYIATTLAVEEGQKSSAYYHEKAMVFAEQLSELQAAKNALEDFFNKVRDSVSPNEAFHTLDTVRKEELRRAYKQFQPFVLAATETHPEFALLNIRLVASLTEGELPQTPLKKADENLTFMKSIVLNDLQELIASSQENKAFYLAQEKEALAQEKEIRNEQTNNVNEAKKAVKRFFVLVKKHMGPNDTFDGLNKKTQDKLWSAYKKIRPQILTVADFRPEFALLDERITASFTSAELSQKPLKKDNESLTLMQATITESLQQQMVIWKEQDKEVFAKLQAAQKAVEIFFDTVGTLMEPHDSFHELDDGIKETLFRAYKQFQPHVLIAAETHPEFALLNTRLIASLSDVKYLAREADTVDTVLNYEATLFGQLAELRLSKKIDAFLTKKLIPYVKENLSSTVWNQLSSDGSTIALTKLPFKNFHQDSSEVILYKQLINAVFHLKSSLAGLENLQGHPSSRIGRGFFVFTAFYALVMDLVGLKTNLSAVAENPGLQALIKENLALLQPLKDLPIIGDYVTAINEPVPTVDEEPADIVALWQEQQELVIANLDPLNTPITKTYIRIFGEDSDRAPELFIQLESIIKEQPSLLAIKDQLQTLYIEIYPYLAETHVATTFSSDYISKLTTEEALEEAVDNLLEIRHITHSHAVKGDFGILGVRHFDNVENKKVFEFYYKKIQPYLVRLDSRYTPTFIESLKTSQGYHNARKHIMDCGDKLQKLVSSEHTPTTLPKRNQEAVEATKVTQKQIETLLAFQRNAAYRGLFGGTNLQDTEFSRAYKQLCTVIAQAHENWNFKKRVDLLERRPIEDPLMSAQEQLESVYAKLYPVLATSPLHAEFPSNFISRCRTEQALKLAIANLHEAYALVISQPGTYTQLRIMAAQLDTNEDYFVVLENRQAFIVLYKKLQPYLALLDAKYNADSFVSALESTDDTGPEIYAAVLRDINNLPDLKNRLEVLVIKEELPPAPKKVAQLHGISTVLTLEQATEMKSIEDSFHRISVKFRELKAPETTNNSLRLAHEKAAKEKELAEIIHKITDLIHGLDITNLDSPTLQEMMDTRQRLTAELAEIEKTQSEMANKVTKKLDEQAKAFLKSVKGLALSPDLLRVLTQVVTALEAQLSRVGKDEREEVRSSIEVVRTEFGIHLQAIATQIETEQDLTAGSLTEKVAAITTTFNSYSDNLISDVYPISYLQLASERLYKIADQLQKQKDPTHVPLRPPVIQEKAGAFAQHLEGLSYCDPRSAKKVLESINRLQEQVTAIGIVSREILIRDLSKIRSELGGQLVEAADNAEYHLGLKPGVLAQPILEHFDDFYTAFVTRITITTDQTDLRLLTDTTLTKNRLAKEQQRLAEIKSDQEAARVEAFIFGPPHKDADTINFYFAALNKTVLDAKTSGRTLSSIKDRIQSYYVALHPYLIERSKELAATFGKDYISSCATEEDLRRAIENLQDEQRFVNTYPGIYDKLSDLAWQVTEEEDEPTPFADTEVGNRNRKQFLRLFEELSPYLLQISSTYSPSSFVRELQTPHDFHTALQGILAEGKKLEELVEGLQDANALRQRIVQERINYVKAKLTEEENLAVKRVEKFKSDTFTLYLHAEVKSKFTQDLGPYDILFVTHMEPDFLAAKLLEGITMAVDIKDTIAKQIEGVTPAIVAKHAKTKQAYAELNANLIRVNEWIKKETDQPKDNACRAEVLSILNGMRKDLLRTEYYQDIAAVVKDNKECEDFFVELNDDYKVAIKLFDTLNQMKAYINQQESKSLDNQAKLGKIDNLQRNLADLSGGSIATRLAAVKEHTKTDTFTTTMTQNSDNNFMQLLKALSSLLFGWKSQEQTMFDSFKDTLTQMKIPTPVSVPEVAHDLAQAKLVVESLSKVDPIAERNVAAEELDHELVAGEEGRSTIMQMS